MKTWKWVPKMIHMRDVYSDNCSKLNRQNYYMLSEKLSRELVYKNNQSIHWYFSAVWRSTLLFQISTSMPESLLRVINLSSLTYPFFELDIEQYDCNVQTFVNQARITDYSVNGLILLLFAISWYFWVIVIEVSMRKGALIREGCLIQT